MSDFVTLTCPACGGRLDVSPTQSTLECTHCGSEHVVRHEAGAISLEAFARCPQCGRNDRVEKVTAIRKSQVREISGTTEVTESYTDSEGKVRSRTRTVPTSSTEASVLAQQLDPPPQPKDLSGGSSCLPTAVFVGGAGLFLSGLFCTLSSCAAVIGANTSDERIAGITSLVFLAGPAIAISVGMVFLGRRLRAKAAEEKQLKLEESRHRLAEWQIAMDRWNAMYYCLRDDGVFIPGEKDFAPLERMQQLIAPA